MNHWQTVRRVVIERDESRCQMCRRDLELSEITIDHITPRSMGGSDKTINLQVLCRTCHDAKTRDDRRRYGKENAA